MERVEGDPAPDALRRDLRRVAAREDTSDPPTTREYDAHGRWSSSTVARGLTDGDGRSWGGALADAGLDGDAARGRGPNRAADEETLRADVRRVAGLEETGDPPTIEEYEECGEWAVNTVTGRLGGDGHSWADALDDAGLDGQAVRERSSAGPPPDADALRRDLRRVAAREDTADPPLMREYDHHGEWTPAIVAYRLGGDGRSWADALDDAGLDGDAAREWRGGGRGGRIAREDLLADLRRVAAREDTADPPTTADYDRHGEWTVETAAARLSDDGHSWADALDAAGLDGDAARGRRTDAADPDAIRADLRRVAAREDTSDPPTTTEYCVHGEWAPATARDRLGGGRSWSGALDDAGLDGDAARERRDGPGPGAARADLRAVAARDDTSDPPTTADYDHHGEWAPATVAAPLGDGDTPSPWAEVLDDAGLDGDAARARSSGGGDELSRDALLDALRDLAATPGTSDPPTTTDMNEVGRHSVDSYHDEFGSWPAALDAAGLDGDAARARATGGPPEQITRADLLADIERVADREDTGDPPRTREYDAHGEYSLTTVYRRLGSWSEALAAAGLDGD